MTQTTQVRLRIDWSDKDAYIVAENDVAEMPGAVFGSSTFLRADASQDSVHEGTREILQRLAEALRCSLCVVNTRTIRVCLPYGISRQEAAPIMERILRG